MKANPVLATWLQFIYKQENTTALIDCTTKNTFEDLVAFLERLNFKSTFGTPYFEYVDYAKGDLIRLSISKGIIRALLVAPAEIDPKDAYPGDKMLKDVDGVEAYTWCYYPEVLKSVAYVCVENENDIFNSYDEERHPVADVTISVTEGDKEPVFHNSAVGINQVIDAATVLDNKREEYLARFMAKLASTPLPRDEYAKNVMGGIGLDERRFATALERAGIQAERGASILREILIVINEANHKEV